MPKWSLLLASLAVSGLGQALAQTSQSLPQVDKTSSNYHEGYSAGCAHASYGNVRDEARFLKDASYHMGWMTGFQNCDSHQTINNNGKPNGPLGF